MKHSTAKRICWVEGCERRHFGRGLCAMHHKRMWRHGNPNTTYKPSLSGLICCVEGCQSPAKAKFMCKLHYERVKRHGSPGNAKSKYFSRDEVKSFLGDLLTLNPATTECIIWPFAKDKLGYAYASVDGEKIRITRYLLTKLEREPREGEHAAHNCGNSSCVNPVHLRWASPLENSHDKYIHGTVPLGESHAGAKLTEIEVLKIRELYSSLGYSQKHISQLFKVSKSTIRQVVRRITWTHI